MASDDDDADTLERELCALEANDDGTVGDEDLADDDDSGDELEDDEVAPGVQEQDGAIIDGIAAEADLNDRLPRLPRSIRIASATSITKVSKMLLLSGIIQLMLNRACLIAEEANLQDLQQSNGPPCSV